MAVVKIDLQATGERNKATVELMHDLGIDTTNWPDIVGSLEDAWATRPVGFRWPDFRRGFLCGIKAAQDSSGLDSEGVFR